MSRRRPGILANYRGPYPEGFTIPKREPTPPDPDRPKTLADELAELTGEFESGSEYSAVEPETSPELDARAKADETIAQHEKFLKDHNIVSDIPVEKDNPPPSPPKSMAQTRFPQPEPPSLLQTAPSKTSPRAPEGALPKTSPRAPAAALPKTSPRALEAALRKSQEPLRQQAGISETSEHAKMRGLNPDGTLLHSQGDQRRVPRPLSLQSQGSQGSQRSPLRETKVSPRRVLAKDKEVVISPPPLSAGVYDTMMREYGRTWVWSLVFLVLLLGAALSYTVYTGCSTYASSVCDKVLSYTGGSNITAAFKDTAAAFRNKTAAVNIGKVKVPGAKTAEELNSDAVIETTAAIDYIANILVDEKKVIRTLEDSPFNKAALPIQELRKQVLETEKTSKSVIFELDRFIAENREVDHAWRSFLQRQIEATAELAGIFDGYATSAGSGETGTNWGKAAHNITLTDFSGISQKANHEGEQLLCHTVGKAGAAACPPQGTLLMEIFKDLKKELDKPNFKIPRKTFETYSASLANVSKVVQQILKRWEKSEKDFENAKLKYKQNINIGNLDKVAKRLEATAKILETAMESPLISQVKTPGFPEAIRKLSQSKVSIMASH
ncbi:hypothetical protein NHQ30_000986 [Ciborinia camelliae]|nr:hypothetical protein NHQ30_000986 [Ciborinia camelliae]